MNTRKQQRSDLPLRSARHLSVPHIAVWGLAGFLLVQAGAYRTAHAALDDEPTTPRAEEIIAGDELTRQVQKILSEMGIYRGAVDGKANTRLRAAIKKYQRMLGRPINGAVTKDLVDHMDTQSKVGNMLQRLDSVRGANIEAARLALLKNEETRKLLQRNKEDDVADPTRDSTPCFRNPEEKCLLTEAVESAKAIHRAELRDWAFGEILVAQAKAGYLEDAISTVQRIGDARLIIVALRDIARAQAQAGRLEGALQVVQIIPDAFKRLEALSAIADIQLKKGDGDGAHETAAQAIALASVLENSLHRVTVLAQMAVILNKVGDLDSARLALEEAQKLARSPEMVKQLSTLEKGAALRHIAAAFSEIGQPTRALSLIEDVSGNYDRTAVLMSAATAQANAGDTDEALETAAKIKSGRYRSVVLGRIAIALAHKNQRQKAIETVEQALDTTNDVELPYARSYAIGQLALALIEIGVQIDNKSLEDAVKTAQEIENDRLRAYMLWTAAAALSKKGMADQLKVAEKLATDATDAIGSSLSQVWMLGDIASEQVRSGQLDRAANAFNKGITIAETIHNAWGRARALAKMASTLHDFR